MAQPPNLTDKQKKELRRLEPALRQAVRLGDYGEAKRITSSIQNLLQPTGHVTRLMQAKNWLFEAAMEAGRIQIAISGLTGVIRMTRPTTRVNLEAKALLAICHLRRDDLKAANPLITQVLLSDGNIKSPERRRQFRRRILARFEEEGVLASLRGRGRETIEPSRIQDEAGLLLASNASERELYERIGDAVPKETVEYLLRIDEFAKKQLPPSEVKYLPLPDEITKKNSLGETVFKPLQRVIWRSLCDPTSEVYKAWFNGGMKVVLNKLYIGSAVATALSNLEIGLKALAVSVAALILKMGIEVYCEIFKPDTVMISRKDNA